MGNSTSLRGRLLRFQIPAIALVLLLSGALLLHLVESQTWREFDRTLLVDAEDLASRFVVEEGELILEDQELELPLPQHYALRDHQGEVVFQAGGLPQDQERSPLRTIRLSFSPRVDLSDEEEALGMEPRFGTAMELQVGDDPSQQQAFLGTLWWSLFACGLGMLLVVAVVTWIGVRMGLHPLARFQQRIQRLDADQLQWEPSRQPLPSELVAIDQELSSLVARLQQAIARERRFIDAAAHELRTPLSELRTVSEVSLQLPHNPEAKKSLEQCREVGLEMEEMVELLLQLSRAPQELSSGQEDMLLQTALLEQIGAKEQDILDKALAVEVKFGPGCPWQIPSTAAHLVARNLIENAIAYTPQGGNLCLTWAQDQAGDSLSIRNGPVSLQESDLAQLVEPFWRGDSARGDRKHHGLGLTLVDTVAKACRLEMDFHIEDEHLVVALRTVI